MDNERTSELTAIGELLGQHRKRYAWPPSALALGVVLRRRRVNVRDPKTQEIKETRTYLVPFVEDPPAFYAHLSARNARPEDADKCASCNGAGYVRLDRPQGSAAFAQIIPCPRWSGDRQRCIEPEPAQGRQWWGE